MEQVNEVCNRRDRVVPVIGSVYCECSQCDPEYIPDSYIVFGGTDEQMFFSTAAEAFAFKASLHPDDEAMSHVHHVSGPVSDETEECLNGECE